MARYWLGPWTWIDSPLSPFPHWAAPAGAVASLDLRSIPQCAGTITPAGFGLFVTANAVDLGSSYENLGTDPLRIWTEQQKARWQSALSLPATLTANTLRGILWETLTIQADPIGDDRALPIVPAFNARRYHLWLAGQLIDSKAFRLADPESAPLIDLLKRQYRRIRQCCLDGVCSPNLYRKWLGFQVLKYDIAYRNFQPADVPDEEPLEPETIITDDFNRTDADALGSSSEGWSWTEVSGDHDIVSNQVGPGSTGGRARAESDLSSDDHYAQTLQVDGFLSGQGSGPAVRFSAAADTCYMYLNDGARLFKVEAGTLTALTSSIGDTQNGSVIRLEVDGSSLELFDDGVSYVGPITDTSITGNVRTGFHRDATRTLDNFEAADLGGEESSSSSQSGEESSGSSLSSASSLSLSSGSSASSLSSASSQSDSSASSASSASSDSSQSSASSTSLSSASSASSESSESSISGSSVSSASSESSASSTSESSASSASSASSGSSESSSSESSSVSSASSLSSSESSASSASSLSSQSSQSVSESSVIASRVLKPGRTTWRRRGPAQPTFRQRGPGRVSFAAVD